MKENTTRSKGGPLAPRSFAPRTAPPAAFGGLATLAQFPITLMFRDGEVADGNYGCAASQSSTPLYLGETSTESLVFSLSPQHDPVCVYCMKGPVRPAPEMPVR